MRIVLSSNDNKEFTLKVEGARWTNKSGIPLTAEMTMSDFAQTLSEVISMNSLEEEFDIGLDFDPAAQTFTFTADSPLSGSVKFQEPIYGARVTDGGHSATYVGRPIGGLSFD
jgi:hypothetical protein